MRIRLSLVMLAVIASGCTMAVGGRPIVQIGPDFAPDTRAIFVNTTSLDAVLILDTGKVFAIPAGGAFRMNVYASGYGTTENSFVVQLCAPPRHVRGTIRRDAQKKIETSCEVVDTLDGKIRAYGGYGWRNTRSQAYIIRERGERGEYELVLR